MVSNAVLLVKAASASLRVRPASTVTAPSWLPVLGRTLRVRPAEKPSTGASLIRLTVMRVVAGVRASLTPSVAVHWKLSGLLLRSSPAAPAQSLLGV